MSKLQKIRKKLAEKQLDALLITNGYNRRYLTGFTGTAGAAIITETKALFITDFRYTVQANNQVKEFEIIKQAKTLTDEINKQLKNLKVKQLGIEDFDITYHQYLNFQEEFEIKLIPVGDLVETLRLIKSDEEIEIMQAAAKIADDAFNHILNYIKPGRTELDVSNELEFFMRQAGATASSFDTIVASGYRSALPHGVASNKTIEAGELVTLDFGALYEGYCSDITRTVAVGNVNDQLKEIYDIVLQAQLKGVKGVKAGITGHEADALTRDYITEKGYGDYFGHSTGHGLGMEVHENPRLAPGASVILEEGMVVTVEPGIYVPEVGGCRIEDDIVVTTEGNKRLTHADKQFIQL